MSEQNGKKKILIVDDESAISGLISEFCQSFGFDTKVLNDAENVVETAEVYQPDLITLDLVMPEMSGVEIMEKLKINEKTKNIPVIIISSIAGSNSLKDVLSNLPRGILGKPVQMKNLRDTIEKALT